MDEQRIAFIFDLDGTLVDSFEAITAAANRIRVLNGSPPLETMVAERLIGLPAADLFRDIANEVEVIDSYVFQFRQLLGEQILQGNKVYNGAVEFINVIRAKKIWTAIATSKPKILAEKVVQNSSLYGLIDFVQGTDGFNPKPDPEVILRAMASVNSQTAIMFGDRPEDIIAAKSANIPAIGISQSVFSSSELLDSGASLVYDNFNMALDGINEILSLLLRGSIKDKR